MLAVDAGAGWYLVYPARRYEGDPVATALLRRGVPRGVDIAIDAIGANDAVASRTRAEAEAVGAWHHTSLAAWARRGAWGFVNDVPFNRARVREVMRRYPWADGAPWSVVTLPEGHCLVMRGPRGQRALVMRGAESARPECTGRALVGGAR